MNNQIETLEERTQNTNNNNEMQIYTDVYLEKIKNEIEAMTKIQHIEVLKILKKHKTIKLNENKNGVYVNLSFLSKSTIEELEKYIAYIHDQNKFLEEQT